MFKFYFMMNELYLFYKIDYISHPKNIEFTQIIIFTIKKNKNTKSCYFCSTITFNNHLKVCFSNKKYIVLMQTRLIQIESNLFRIFNIILKGYRCANLITQDIRGNKFSPHTNF